ncbi:hypothetical protein pdul_cds_383 [Pandoravirus dulcis]|uniref:F-box domain containing protein n=1 Tax=Pandoravirus dulcis TaxID=1349409 RepID=S4VWX9_9VIRU|nr:hypothetical protein pdul_cds_383 [Pandoravirus dulcis]AGO82419.1 hypothetical protein pdul_cds_383 [Pandoravirus dulcis]
MEPASAFVVAGLPIELWRLVFGGCDRIAAARLGATCRTLHAESAARVRRRVAAARLVVDTFVDRWQRHTARWDTSSKCGYDYWRRCEEDDEDERDKDNGNEEQDDNEKDDDGSRGGHSVTSPCRGVVRWSCQRRPPKDPSHAMLCDACARPVIDAGATGGWLAHPVDMERPHVWAAADVGTCTMHPFWADDVDDARFCVPSAAAHLTEPSDAMARCEALFYGQDTELAMVFSGMSWATLGSLRGWLPLSSGGCAGGSARPLPRVPMICCDTGNPLWGQVALVEYGTKYPCLSWHGVGATLEVLLARYRHAHARHAWTDWVAWACDMYIGDEAPL